MTQSKLKIKELVLFAALGAILFVLQVALRSIPNVEMVSFLIFIYAAQYSWKSLYPIYVFVLLEGILYGFGSWWFGYLYVWLVLALIPIVLNKLHIKITPIICAVSLLIYGLIFGMLFALEYAVLDGVAAGWAYWLSGLPYDAIHGIANCAIGLVLYKPVETAFCKINTIFN